MHMGWKTGILFVAVLLLTVGTAYAQEGEDATPKDLKSFGVAIGAALSIGLAAIGAGYAIGHAGAAAMGAIAEKPEVATWGLIIVALAEGIALYGLVIGFMLVGKL